MEVVEFGSEVFVWDGGTWFFVRLTPDAADDVRDLTTGPPTGFGSVRVEATIGTSTWQTSVFPDKGSGSFVLPVKKAVRAAEDLDDGTPVTVSLRVLG